MDAIALHESAHVFAALGMGGRVSSVKLNENGGITFVSGLSRVKRLTVRVAGRVAGDVFGHPEPPDASREDYAHAHLAAACIVGACERVTDSRRAVPRPRATGEMFAALDRDPDAVVEIVARHPRACRLVELAEVRAEEILAANRVAVEHFASVLAARGSLNEDEILSVFGEALDLQDKEEASCSRS
jgi:hypothetical protein